MPSHWCWVASSARSPPHCHEQDSATGRDRGRGGGQATPKGPGNWLQVMPTPTPTSNVLQPGACSDFTGASCLATLFPSGLCHHGTCCQRPVPPAWPRQDRPHSGSPACAHRDRRPTVMSPYWHSTSRSAQLTGPACLWGGHTAQPFQPCSPLPTPAKPHPLAGPTWHNQWVYGR